MSILIILFAVINPFRIKSQNPAYILTPNCSRPNTRQRFFSIKQYIPVWNSPTLKMITSWHCANTPPLITRWTCYDLFVETRAYTVINVDPNFVLHVVRAYFNAIRAELQPRRLPRCSNAGNNITRTVPTPSDPATI